MMKLAKKLLLFACILTLCLGFTLTAQAADRQFKKQTVFFKEGQSKNLTLLNSETTPEVLYYDADSALFSYQVKGASSIRITANRPGIDYITVKNDGENISCCLVILPKNNPAVKTRVTKKGNTVVTYKKARVVLPPAWKKYGYVLLPHEDSISFCSKTSYRSGYYGTVFTIAWCSEEEYVDRASYLPNFRFLKRSGGLVYYIELPTDVQFHPEKAKCQRHYNALEKTVKSIRKTFRVKAAPNPASSK